MLIEVRQASGSRQSSEDGRAELVLVTNFEEDEDRGAYLHQGLTTRADGPGPQDGERQVH